MQDSRIPRTLYRIDYALCHYARIPYTQYRVDYALCHYVRMHYTLCQIHYITNHPYIDYNYKSRLPYATAANWCSRSRAFCNFWNNFEYARKCSKTAFRSETTSSRISRSEEVSGGPRGFCHFRTQFWERLNVALSNHAFQATIRRPEITQKCSARELSAGTVAAAHDFDCFPKQVHC